MAANSNYGKALDVSAIVGQALANQAKSNQERAKETVVETFLSVNRTKFNCLPVSVVKLEDGVLVATARFRPYRGDDSHTGLSEAAILTNVTDEELDEKGNPVYKVTGEGVDATRHAKILSVQFGKFDGLKFFPETV